MSLVVMKGLRRGCPAASIGIGLALLGAFLDGGLLSSAAGQDGADTRPASESESSAIPVDEGEFVLKHPPRQRDTPGVLKYGGYCQVGPSLTKYSYRDGNDPAREAIVEVVVHPDGYNYVIHDFFGTFWVVLNDPMARGSSHSPPGVFGFTNVAPAATEKPQHLCVAVFQDEDPQSEETFEGITGWYGDSGNTITTVMIRFSGLKGIPTALIAKYLAEHPSSMQEDDPRFANWEANDIAKWSTLLQTRANEDVFLAVAAVHLRHHDKRSFGLMELPGKQLDPAARSAGVNAAIERMQEWLEKRQRAEQDEPKSQGEEKQP